MGNLGYSFRFGEIKDGLCQAEFLNCRTNEAFKIGVGIDDTRLMTMTPRLLSSPLADLIDLGLACYIADRLSKRHADVRRHIFIELPVRYPEIFSQSEVIQKLSDCLFHYTRDHWTFSFTRRIACGRMSEQRLSMWEYFDSEVSAEIALWSGGLDSLAGLHKRLLGPNVAERYILFGTGSNPMIHHQQELVYQTAREIFARGTKRSLELTRALIRSAATGPVNKNRTPRARGFVFIMLGAVCAAFNGQRRLMVYENGIGAINLPYRQSEVGIDNSKAVNPESLEKMEQLISLILGEPFSIYNPFLFITKAQLCEPLVRRGAATLIGNTLSCDRRHRSTPMQCGRCTSCLLRRQALVSCGMIEPTATYQSTSSGKALGLDARRHLGAMLAQVRSLEAALETPMPWKNLVEGFPQLDVIADTIARQKGLPVAPAQERLVKLYSDYVSEWRGVQHIVGAELDRESEPYAA